MMIGMAKGRAITMKLAIGIGRMMEIAMAIGMGRVMAVIIMGEANRRWPNGRPGDIDVLPSGNAQPP